MSLEREQHLEQALAKLERVHLAQRPTPLESLPRLSEALGGPMIYMKRDDLTGLAFGGNKTRMLEFSLADAIAKGVDVIVAGAAVQSNYCRQLAAACAKLGIELHLVLRPEREQDLVEVQGNHFLQRLYGAQTTILETNDHAVQQQSILAKIDELGQEGRTVYWPRQQDTVDLDAIAYAEVALEIVRQCRALGIHPAYLYAAAMDTTQAGLVLGMSYLRSPIHVRGISPFQDVPERMANMARMANQAAHRLQLDIDFAARDFDNDDSFVGERYGIPTVEGIEAIHSVARSEGIALDPVYTSKAMAALISHIRSGKVDASSPVIFLHTGGAPALFAYASDVIGPR
jgi:1-aminocyclopropane-1-carboxylate deaminase/D-cysteine desulfhydrase-like pyridoxal-dependent ACC family enzyme